MNRSFPDSPRGRVIAQTHSGILWRSPAATIPGPGDTGYRPRGRSPATGHVAQRRTRTTVGATGRARHHARHLGRRRTELQIQYNNTPECTEPTSPISPQHAEEIYHNPAKNSRVRGRIPPNTMVTYGVCSEGVGFCVPAARMGDRSVSGPREGVCSRTPPAAERNWEPRSENRILASS